MVALPPDSAEHRQRQWDLVRAPEPDEAAFMAAASAEEADPGFVRALLTSNPKPYPPLLTLSDDEVVAVGSLSVQGRLRVGRADRDAAEERAPGWVRLYERGLITPIPHTLTPRHCEWRWRDLEARYDAARMAAEAWGLVYPVKSLANVNLWLCRFNRHDEPSLGAEGLLAALVWHYQHTDVVRLSIVPDTQPDTRPDTQPDTNHLHLVEHHRAGSSTTRMLTAPHDRTLDGLEDVFLRLAERADDSTAPFGRRYDPQDGLPRLDDDALGLIAFTLAEIDPSDLNAHAAAAEGGSAKAVEVDLDRWRLYEPGLAPAPSFSDTLPSALTNSMSLLGAPAFADQSEFMAWAETALVMAYMCSGKPEHTTDARGRTRRKIAGQRKHTLHINPHTGQTQQVVKNDAEQERINANHVLWALLVPDSPNQCANVAVSLDWVGSEANLAERLWSPQAAKRMYAIRTVCRAVQYLDAGLGLREQAAWLAMNLPAELVERLEQGIADGLVTRDLAHFHIEDRLQYPPEAPTTRYATGIIDWLMSPDFKPVPRRPQQ